MIKELFKNKEKGISLLVTFFVMCIILAAVLGISTILYGELKMVMDTGYSTVAFFTGDSGIEQSLYYDNKVVEVGADRGICNICTSCLHCTSCQAVETAVGGCNPCTDCDISYTTDLGDRLFNLLINVTSLSGDTFQSIGEYRGTKRSIEVKVTLRDDSPAANGPEITNAQATFTDTGIIEIFVTADVTAAYGIDGVDAYVYIIDGDNNYVPVSGGAISLTNGGVGDTFTGTEYYPSGYDYHVNVVACDLQSPNPQCAEVDDI